MDRCGIGYPEIIDLITRANDIFSLVLVQRPELAEDDAPALQDKLNNYLGFAVDGALKTRYPESEGKAVCIRVELNARPAPFIYEFLNQYADAVAHYGVSLEVCLDGEVIICGE